MLYQIKTARTKSFFPLSSLKLTQKERDSSLNIMSSFIDDMKDGPIKDSSVRSLTKKLVSNRSDKLKARAILTFKGTEETCRITNQRFRLCDAEFHRNLPIIQRASKIISKILGSVDIDKIISFGQFGPGSTSSITGFDVSATRKFADVTVTSQLKTFAQQWLGSFPMWSSGIVGCDPSWVSPTCLETCHGSRFSSVPKDDTTDRLIASEPTINSFFQQAAGRFMRKQFRRTFSVDLDDQTTNQRLAQLGSIDNSLATIDLSNASNLISIEVVRLLLPSDWYHLLSLLRSHSMEVEGKFINLESFSSMGNGFTFDLQSILFYSICRATVELEGYNPFWVNTFGDDIVIPSGCYNSVVNRLEFFGFSVNMTKSFYEGPFRESCGHDYLNGVNIRPVYVKNLSTYVDVMNIITRWLDWGLRVSTDVTSLISDLSAIIPKHLRFLGPLQAITGSIPTPFDVAVPSVAGKGWQGYHFKYLMPVLPVKEEHSRHYMTASLFYGYDFNRNRIPIRKDPIGYKVVLGYCLDWD